MPDPENLPRMPLALPPWRSEWQRGKEWLLRALLWLWEAFHAISGLLDRLNGWIAKKLNIASTKWFVGAELGFIFFLGLGMIQVDEYAVALAAWIVFCFIWASKAASHEWKTQRQWAKALKTSSYLLLIMTCCVAALVWTNIRRDSKEWTNFQKLRKSKPVAQNKTSTPAPVLAKSSPSPTPVVMPSPYPAVTPRPTPRHIPKPTPTSTPISSPSPTVTPVPPPSRAEMQFSFYTLDIKSVPFREITLPEINGVVTVDFFARNTGENIATNGELIIYICEECKFAKEPNGFAKLSGANELQRNHSFQRVFPDTFMPKMTFEVMIPSKYAWFEIAGYFYCDLCAKSVPQVLRVY